MLARRVGPVRRGARGRPDGRGDEESASCGVCCMVWDVEVGDEEGVALDDGGDRAQQCRRAVGVCSVSTACYQCTVKEEVMSQRPESKSLDDAPRRRAAQYRGRQTPPRPPHDTLRRFHGRQAGEVDEDPSELW